MIPRTRVADRPRRLLAGFFRSTYARRLRSPGLLLPICLPPFLPLFVFSSFSSPSSLPPALLPLLPPLDSSFLFLHSSPSTPRLIPGCFLTSCTRRWGCEVKKRARPAAQVGRAAPADLVSVILSAGESRAANLSGKGGQLLLRGRGPLALQLEAPHREAHSGAATTDGQELKPRGSSPDRRRWAAVHLG